VSELVGRIVEGVAASAGATAGVEISEGIPVTYNDPGLTRRMVPTLVRVAGRERVVEVPPATAAEDFSYFQKEIPGFYFFLGVAPDSIPPERVAPNHSPYFFADESALPVGVRAMANLAVDYLAGSGAGGG